MKRKSMLFLICCILVLGLITGCGNKDSKEGFNSSIEFDYSKINTASENIGKNVDVQAVLNEDIKPKAYEGVTFTGDTGDLNEANVKTENINWVIFAEDNNNYMLTTVKPTGDTVELKGADGYNNGVQAMNAYCAKYYSIEIEGKKYVARSLNMNDIEAYYKDKTDIWKRETLGFEGYNKSGIEATGYQYYPSLYAMESGSDMGGKLDVNETPDNYEPYNNNYKSDGTSTANYLNTYYYANKTQLKDNFANEKAYNIIFESGTGYWVATRSVAFYDSKMSSYEISKGSRNTPSAVDFGMRMVAGGEIKHFRLMKSNSQPEIFYKNMISTRPVVVVPKSEIDL